MRTRSFGAGCFRGDAVRWSLRLRGCFPSEYRLNLGVFALLYLKDGTTGLCRAQSPFDVVTIFPTLWQSIARADGLEVEAVNKFLRSANFNRGKDDLIKARRDRSNSITPRRNSSTKPPGNISAGLLDDFACALAQQRNYRAGNRISFVISYGSRNRRQVSLAGARRRYLRVDARRKHRQQ